MCGVSYVNESVHTDCEFCVYVRVYECVKMFMTSVIEYVANTTRALGTDTVDHERLLLPRALS